MPNPSCLNRESQTPANLLGLREKLFKNFVLPGCAGKTSESPLRLRWMVQPTFHDDRADHRTAAKLFQRRGDLFLQTRRIRKGFSRHAHFGSIVGLADDKSFHHHVIQIIPRSKDSLGRPIHHG